MDPFGRQMNNIGVKYITISELLEPSQPETHKE